MPLDGAFSPLHWLVIVVVALLVFGPNELPDIAKRVGRGFRELKQIQQQLLAELDGVTETREPSPEDKGTPAPGREPPIVEPRVPRQP